MSMVFWFAIAIVAVLGTSAVAGLAVAAVLGVIGNDVAELLDTEPWTLAQPMRATTAAGGT